MPNPEFLPGLALVLTKFSMDALDDGATPEKRGEFTTSMQRRRQIDLLQARCDMLLPARLATLIA
jgi:hypothetical protein